MTSEGGGKSDRLKPVPVKAGSSKSQASKSEIGEAEAVTSEPARYHRRENITDWALEQFRARYGDPSISKWDVFHYVYAILHHPEYRERYAANLRRELQRIPFVSATRDHVGTATPGCPAEQSSAALKGDGLGRPESRNKKTGRDDSLANHPAVMGEDASSGAAEAAPFQSSSAQANSRSHSASSGQAFDSVSGLASESTHSAQDDRVGVKAQDDRVKGNTGGAAETAQAQTPENY